MDERLEDLIMRVPKPIVEIGLRENPCATNRTTFVSKSDPAQISSFVYRVTHLC
jgi:hypothetical protein